MKPAPRPIVLAALLGFALGAVLAVLGGKLLQLAGLPEQLIYQDVFLIVLVGGALGGLLSLAMWYWLHGRRLLAARRNRLTRWDEEWRR